VPVPQLVNYRYTVVQLRPKRSLLHRNNIWDLHARTSNEKFVAFSPSDYSVSILTSSPLLSSGSTATTEIWRPIDFSRWLPQTLNTTSGFVFVDVLAFRRSKFINKPDLVDINGQHISIYGWDITNSGLKNKRPPYWNSTSGCDLDHFPVICILFCISLPNFVQIRAPTAEIWHYFHFSRWQPRPLNTSSGFVFVDVTVFRRSVYQQNKFCGHVSIGGWDITTSSFEIQMSAILEFYFLFWSRPVRRNLHVILHQATEFRPNRSTQCGNMTS